jgi:uncharacterized membrane protein
MEINLPRLKERLLPGRPELTKVSELIAFVFRDQFRAPEVLNELRRRDWEWIGDLEKAVAVTINPDRKARVHLSVDPLAKETGWTRLWGSLLSTTLFLPLPELLGEAADGVRFSKEIDKAGLEKFAVSRESQWWHDTLQLSENFRRDVAALLAPGGSAIFMILRETNLRNAFEQLHNYGNTIVHTTVSAEQDDKLLAMLSS